MTISSVRWRVYSARDRTRATTTSNTREAVTRRGAPKKRRFSTEFGRWSSKTSVSTRTAKRPIRLAGVRSRAKMPLRTRPRSVLEVHALSYYRVEPASSAYRR